MTPDVFQLEIGPQESSVFDEFEFHSRTILRMLPLSMVSQSARLWESKLQVTHTASRKEVFLCRNRIIVVVCGLLLVVCACSTTISSSAPIATMTQKCSCDMRFQFHVQSVLTVNKQVDSVILSVSDAHRCACVWDGM